MKKSIITGSFLILLLLSVVVIAGCSGFSGNDRGKCNEGESCRFYTGNRGVMMYLDKPQTKFYYRSSDLSQPDGNVMDLNIRLANDGASDSYGAVFVSGFSGDMFQICDISSTSKKCVNINKDRGSCYFDIQSLGQQVGDWNMLVGCFGASVSTFGGTNKIDLGQQFFKTLSDQFGWAWTDKINGVNFAWSNEGGLNLGIGSEFGVLNYGRSLMILVSTLDFESLGGSVFTMKGDNIVSPGGDIDYKTFQVQMIAPWPAGQDYFRIPYQIKSCYAYTTFVSPSLCIDPDPFSEEKKVCTSEAYAWGGSQGAPVAVTNLVQTNTGKEVVVEITIKNVGPGRVWDVGYLEACSPYFPGEVRSKMLNVIHIGYARVGTKPLDCTNYYRVVLNPTTQEAKLTCRYNMNGADDIGSAYTVPLSMELWYGYEETITSQVTVQRLN